MENRKLKKLTVIIEEVKPELMDIKYENKGFSLYEMLGALEHFKSKLMSAVTLIKPKVEKDGK